MISQNTSSKACSRMVESIPWSVVIAVNPEIQDLMYNDPPLSIGVFKELTQCRTALLNPEASP